MSRPSYNRTKTSLQARARALRMEANLLDDAHEVICRLEHEMISALHKLQIYKEARGEDEDEDAHS